MKGHEHLTAAKALLVEAQRTYANMPEASLARMTEVSVLQGLAMAHTRVADLCFQIDSPVPDNRFGALRVHPDQFFVGPPEPDILAQKWREASQA